MSSTTIRRQFLHFFKEKGHTIVPSSSVIPHDDPTLLFTNAGMNQFKDVFLGKSVRDYKRAVTSQKCIRAGGKHNDLENVGHTSRHLTFFEMLGNFSFGDYFKKEAIDFAWNFVETVLEFDPKFLFATVFLDDEESFELWKRYLPEHKIIRMGEKDNFWSMGESGPCGPCTELYYDKGHLFGSGRNPSEDVSGERFIEFWNLVFMEFNRKGPKEIERLPKQSVDTGAGLERIMALKIGASSLFETDIFRELIAQIEKVFHVSYDAKDEKKAPAFHVIADHLRTLSFAIADGAQPSNIERGYVLRKILRRAVRYGRYLHKEEPFLAKILPRLVSLMGEDYPELKQGEMRIAEILTLEEEAFLRTLRKGGELLHIVMEEAKKKGGLISGSDAFKLKDTYGFPLEEINLLAIDNQLKIDLEEFKKLEGEAKEKSRKARKETAQGEDKRHFETLLAENGPTRFVGYHATETQATILALFKNGECVTHLNGGEEGAVVLDTTPFYAEKGGQIGDTGLLEKEGDRFEVIDTQSPFTGIVTHVGTVLEGHFTIGDRLNATIDSKRRKHIANNHTATHLLHFALQKVLGEQIKQAGSLVEEQRLRFDFNHHKPLNPQELLSIEDVVNELIRENAQVVTSEISYEEARSDSGIKQFFGEKYGKEVRVVAIGNSKELCGGTHTTATGTIGLFKIVKESSISAGVRRIEAVTGKEAEKEFHQQETLILDLCKKLKVQPQQLSEKIDRLSEEVKETVAQRDSLQKELFTKEIATLKLQVFEIQGVRILIHLLKQEAHHLKMFSELMAEGESIAVLFITPQGQMVAKVTPDLIQKGIRANEWLKATYEVMGGRGGGKPDYAQGVGLQLEKINDALAKAKQWIAWTLNS